MYKVLNLKQVNKEKIGVDILKASDYIKNGEIVVFPTETVYGIGANALDENAVSKIFKAKNRPMDNPLIVHISDYNMLESITENITDLEKRIMDKFWPGPLSIILNKKENILPDNVTASLSTVAVRMPSNKIALELIKKTSLPIAAPSANVSSRPSGTNIDDIYEELNLNVSYFLDGKESEIGLESTVIRVINDEIIILRPGKITIDDLKVITDKVTIDKNCITKLKSNEKVLSPGMKHKHYAPTVKCTLLEIDNINNLKNSININEKLALLLTTDYILKIQNQNQDDFYKRDNIKLIDIGNDTTEISKNLFKNLRKLNTLELDNAYIQSFKFEGENIAIMNRLVKTCEYRKIRV